MKLLKKIKIKNAPLTVLFLGTVSTFFSAVFLLLVRYTVNKKALIGYASYYGDALKEIAFCALLHIAVAALLYIGERKK